MKEALLAEEGFRHGTGPALGNSGAHGAGGADPSSLDQQTTTRTMNRENRDQ